MGNREWEIGNGEGVLSADVQYGYFTRCQHSYGRAPVSGSAADEYLFFAIYLVEACQVGLIYYYQQAKRKYLAAVCMSAVYVV